MAKQHLPNAVCGVLDYAAYPVGMLLVAPVILRCVGVERYGVWAVATAAISAGSILASGFGDANIQQIASDRGAGDSSRLLQTVRSTMGIHVVLGLCIGLIGWMVSPYVARHVVAHDAALETDCLWSLRIAGVVMLVRAIESVCISTQRAFERYGPAVYVSIAGRLLSLALAAVLACISRSVAGILAASLVVIVASVWMQLGRLRVLLGAGSLGPRFERDSFCALFHFGIFSWLQALAAIIVGQADRLVAGVALGATAVASYALCVQIAQPLYGLTSSGLHFLFPHLAGRRAASSATELRRIVGRAFLVNLGMTAVGTALLLVLGTRVIRVLAGESIAAAAAPVLPLIVWGTALLAMSVTAYYALLAFGRVRIVTFISIAGGCAMLLPLGWLIRSYGVHGIAIARLAYGGAAMLLYVPLVLFLNRERSLKLPAASFQRFRFARPGKMDTHVATVRDSSAQHANVLGIQVEALNMDRAVGRVAEVLESGEKGYVSVIGVHGIMEAQRNPRLAAIYADSAITIPDGMPTVWVGRIQGCQQMQRVAGPDLMLEICRSPHLAGYTHFFYGGEPGVAEQLAANLKEWFPWLRICGTYTPPFRDLNPEEEVGLIARVRKLKPDIVWVGISTPRQEAFMHRYLPKLETRLMFGVGAAFDYHTGRIKDCPEWVKYAGLQWLHRLLQNPRRLWRRYLRNNPVFLWQIMLQLAGIRAYSLARPRKQTATAGQPATVLRETGSD
ncbi:MAG: WecB/TagA/CpsF family glycosyltransferase [Acidobacteriaceae bacterium]